MSDGPAPRISSIALANLIKDHRAKNEWNTAIEFYLRGYEDLEARIAELRRFAVGILDLCPHTECEGIQELAVNHGVLVEVTVTEPCGDNCECAEVSDFPLTCYRLAPEFADEAKHG